MTLLNCIRIVLVEPAGARNVGSIARVMKNMGLQQLWIVKPECDPLGLEAQHMAVHAKEILASARIVDSLPAALQGCGRSIATVGRETPRSVEPLRSVLPWLLDRDSAKVGDHALGGDVAIIFGREDHGLSNEELQYAQRLVTIPTHPAYPSLNLAQAVGIVCYELFQVQGQESKLGDPSRGSEGPLSGDPPAPFQALEAFYQGLEVLLLQIGYLYPKTAFSRMQKFRRLLNRSQPSAAEVAMLRGILRQAHWALGQGRSTTGQPNDDAMIEGKSDRAIELDCIDRKMSDGME
ncbi:RNA methyltransferase [Alkalinema sp. FACHB-956]|uniref:RNA methyltransferase n=1 Tax=Alkalinema sp. FACHB-956 TaxID=2692768 RepID=UPI001687FE37|nr:RNA methyltransferase [Alkalinema sp. FACHB-956]MBD2327142.1 RNA methyltransferase [Alkalinema sp. FACHB-956]